VTEFTSKNPARLVWRLMPLGVMLAVAWMLACCLAMIFFPLLSDLSVTDINLTARLDPPVGFGGDWSHPLGTDDLGRDVLARLISSIRTSLLIALGAVAISGTIGTLIGITAAHMGGWVDQLIVGAVDAQVSVPFIIISLTLTAIFGNSIVLFIVVLGALHSPCAGDDHGRPWSWLCAGHEHPWVFLAPNLPKTRLAKHREHVARDDDHQFSRGDLARNLAQLSRPRHTAPDDKPRQYAGIWPRLPVHRVVDRRCSGTDNLSVRAFSQRYR
jgi:hypothetical protein